MWNLCNKSMNFLVLCWLSFDIYIQMCNPASVQIQNSIIINLTHTLSQIFLTSVPFRGNQNSYILCASALDLPLLEFHIIESKVCTLYRRLLSLYIMHLNHTCCYVSVVLSFLLLSSISLFEYATFYPSLLLMGTCLVSSLMLLCINCYNCIFVYVNVCFLFEEIP